MKQYIKFSFIVIILFVSLTSCKKNNLVVDKDPITVSAGQFLVSKYTLTYPIQSSGIPFKIPVAITNIASGDRVIPVTYSSPTGAVLGTDFNAPSSVTIKGGKVFDTLVISGIYSQYASGKQDSIKVKLGGGTIAGVDGKDSVWVILQKFCDIDFTILAGDYLNTAEYLYSSGSYTFSYGYPSQPYTNPLVVSNLTYVSGSTTKATGTFTNLGDAGWSDITFTMDWTDPSNFIVTIDPQDTNDPAGNTQIRTSLDLANHPSTFSSCKRTFTLVCDILDPATNNPIPGLANYKFEVQ